MLHRSEQILLSHFPELMDLDLKKYLLNGKFADGKEFAFLEY